MDNDIKITGILIGAIAGVYGWLLKHLSNPKKHPCADDFMPKGECASERHRLEDCIEGQVKIQNLQYKNLTEKIDELKKLIIDGRGRT